VQLHDYFGRGANEVMHRLRAIRDRARREAGTPREAPAREAGA
jgi:hypothetical protein